jgi:ribonuclease P protein component
MKDESFPRTARLRASRDIQHLLRTGKRCSVACIDIFIGPAKAEAPRLGVIVPRYGRSAVERNRLRRRLKEIARRDWLPAARTEGKDLDVLVRAREAAYDRSFGALQALLLDVREGRCGG